MPRKAATRRDGLAVCFMAWGRYRDQKFPISTKSVNYPALLRAQSEGWIWLVDQKTAALTTSGIAALADYGVKPP